MLRIALADDHAVVREGIRRIIEGAPDFLLVGEAATGPEALALVLNHEIDVCVTDLDMPGGGLALVERLHEIRPKVRILVLSQHSERDFALRALAAGAHGYLNKATGPAVIEAAIRQVGSGHRYLSEETQELAVARLVGDLDTSSPPHAALTSRELEVVLLLAHGARVSDIGLELGISFKTVSTHRTHILEKLGLDNNVELALYAKEHDLI